MVLPMPLLVGGRGKKAPWEIGMVRTPEPIKPDIQKLVDDWKLSQLEDGYTRQVQIVSVDKARSIVEKVLRQKRSARVSVLAVLAELGLEIDL
jgi:hypothetical protein